MSLKEYLRRIVPDDIYLKYKFYKRMKTRLDLDNPKTFNQKLQWLKLYNRNPEYTKMVDKYEVKKYVSGKIGEEYIIPTLGVWDSPEEIDFDKLPDKFVLKCNHNSGLGMCICKDKKTLNINKVKEDLKKGLAENYYWNGREWPYKNVKPKIIAEKYMEDETTQELTDYKFFCFDGYVDNVMIVVDRCLGNPKYYHFDRNWKLCKNYNRLCRSLPPDFTIPKPNKIDEMFELASLMSIGIPHVRIDFYLVNNKIYFGEYTFFSESGFDTGYDEDSDLHLGSLIKLPNKFS